MRNFLVLMLVGVVAGTSSCQSLKTEAVKPVSSVPMRPVRQLRADLVGKSMEQVVAILGKPSEVYTISGGESWNYENASRDSVTGRTVHFMEIVFQKRKVTSVDFSY
ncbi:hypothetical protein BH09VER1_BH09VER1_41890 [soil metagenome]